MRRHKIVARIFLLILSVISFALAAPVLVRGIREVRVDVVNVAKDVTTASRGRWHPSDKWWTNAADRVNTQSSLGSRDSDPHDPFPTGSPPPAYDILSLPADVHLNAPPEPSSESTASDSPHPLPVDLPRPAHNLNKLSSDIDLNDPPRPSPGPTDQDNSHPLPSDSVPPAHKNVPLGIDLNVPQPNTQDDAHPLPASDLAPPAHKNVPQNIDLNVLPQLDPQDSTHPLPVDAPPSPAQDKWPLNIDLNAFPQASHESDSSEHSSDYYSTTDESDYDSASSWAAHSGVQPEAPTSSAESDVPIPPASEAPTASSESDETIPSEHWYPISVFEHPKSAETSSALPDDSNPPLAHGYLGIDLNRAPPTPPPMDDQPPLAPLPDRGKRPAHPLDDDATSSKRPYHPSEPGPSSWADPPSDPGGSTPHPSPGPLHDPEMFFSELFHSSRFKRRISGPRSVNAAEREFQGILGSREYVSTSALPLPPTFHPS